MSSSIPEEKERSAQEEQHRCALLKVTTRLFNHLSNDIKEGCSPWHWQFANDRDRAEELVRETLVRAWTHLPRFQGGASFFTWVYRIMHNLNIDHHRRGSSDERPENTMIQLAAPSSNMVLGTLASPWKMG